METSDIDRKRQRQQTDKQNTDRERQTKTERKQWSNYQGTAKKISYKLK